MKLNLSASLKVCIKMKKLVPIAKKNKLANMMQLYLTNKTKLMN